MTRAQVTLLVGWLRAENTRNRCLRPATVRELAVMTSRRPIFCFRFMNDHVLRCHVLDDHLVTVQRNSRSARLASKLRHPKQEDSYDR
jgi:hypothetical protein